MTKLKRKAGKDFKKESETKEAFRQALVFPDRDENGIARSEVLQYHTELQVI